MIAEISAGIARGDILAPASKSMAHRLLISAGLSQGKSIIHQVDLNEDIEASLNCLKALGARYTCHNQTIRLSGIKRENSASPLILNCNESGSTLRFMIPLVLLQEKKVTFLGSDRLLERPLTVYEDIFRKDLQITYEKKPGKILLQGQLKPGHYEIPGNISSQFITGLLFALPLLEESSQIKITPPIESLSYLLMTLDALNTFGIEVKQFSDSWNPNQNIVLKIPGKQKYLAQETSVEGDYSNAAFFAALNYLRPENQINLTGLMQDSLQGDKAYLDIFESLAQAKDDTSSLSLADCPDLGPIAFTLAAALKGAIFTDTKRLAIKESDRAKVMAEELRKFGAQIEVMENEVHVKNVALHKPNQVLYGHNDHRIVMSLAILASLYGGKIQGAEAINKSFPSFFEKLSACGIDIKLENESD